MQYIYFVGKPYPHRASLELIRSFGYGLGIFLDLQAKLQNADLFDRVVPVDFSNFERSISQITPDPEITGVLCIYETYVSAKAMLSTQLGLPGSSLPAAQACTDKLLMRQAFMRADPAITPDFAHITSQEILLQFAKEHAYPLFIKPTNLVKSLLVLRCDSEDQLLSNYTFAQDNITQLYETYHVYGHKPQLIVEEGIVGQGCSVAAFVDAEGSPHYCPGIVQLTTAQDKGVADNYLYKRELPGEFEPDLEARIFATATKGIKALDMRSTPAHVEMIYSDLGEVKIVEIGARIGGYRTTMYQLSYGLSLVEQEVRIATGEQPKLLGSPAAHTAVYELFPDKVGSFVGIEGGPPAQAIRYSVKTNPGQTIGPAKQGYRAAGVVIISAADRAAFVEQSKQTEALRVQVGL